MEDVTRVTPHIYAALEYQQAAYQASMVKVEGRISKQYISILIDLGSTHSYVNPKVVESC